MMSARLVSIGTIRDSCLQYLAADGFNCWSDNYGSCDQRVRSDRLRSDIRCTDCGRRIPPRSLTPLTAPHPP